MAAQAVTDTEFGSSVVLDTDRLVDFSVPPASAEPVVIDDATRIDLFKATCARWASRSGSDSDAAAVEAVTANTPLARLHDPARYGLDPATRLAPAHLLSELRAVKDEARSEAHAAATRSARAALQAALMRPKPDLASRPPPPYAAVAALLEAERTLAATPAAVGLACACRAALGKVVCAAWATPRAQLDALGHAGAGLVEALIADAWDVAPLPEDPDFVLGVADPRLKDYELMRIIRAVTRASASSSSDEVIPAGKPVDIGYPRSPGTRAAGYIQLWWRLCNRLEGKCRVPHDAALRRHLRLRPGIRPLDSVTTSECSDRTARTACETERPRKRLRRLLPYALSEGLEGN